MTQLANQISELLSRLKPDPWRLEVGFHDVELKPTQDAILSPEASEREIVETVSAWLQRYQPCLFGRIAAKLGLLSYCVLTDRDLRKSDDDIKNQIQSARLKWTRDAYEGKKSGFIIFAVSRSLAEALPTDEMKEFARRLAFLYLETDIEFDTIYTDEIFLEQPGRSKVTWRWPVGVNYFSAQADKRWWQDHRIPGGIAFSMNSVGHMVKSGLIGTMMNRLQELLGTEEQWTAGKVDSLNKALEMAMRSIFLASEAVSGKATELLPAPTDGSLEQCPVELPSFLSDKNFCEYKGWYHTDYTLPSEYFLPDVERPGFVEPHPLDFTYLFRNNLENPDYATIAKGHRIRTGSRSRQRAMTEGKKSNIRKASGRLVVAREQQRLVAALKQNRSGKT